MSHIEYDGPGELHITNITEAAEIDKSPFDRVISACQESIEDNIPTDMNYSHYCMSDGEPVIEGKYGGSCKYNMFREVANELYGALEYGETVLIHCHVGQSRSVSVATAAVGRLLGLTRSESLDLIHHYRIVGDYPDMLLMEHAQRYIREYTDVARVPYNESE